MDGQKCQNKEHGDTMQKKRAACVYVLFRSIKKKRIRRGSVLRATCGIPEQKENFSQPYGTEELKATRTAYFKTQFSETGAQIWKKLTRDQNDISFTRNNGSQSLLP